MPKALLMCLLTLSIACAGPESATEPGEADRVAGPPAAEGAATSAPAEGPSSFTDADLDAWARGLAREIELVRQAQQRASQATTPAERGAAAQAQWDDATIPEGATAAGMSVERYREVREAVHGTLRQLDFQGKIDGPLSIDLERLAPEQRAKYEEDPYEALTPEAAAALRARLDRAVPLWSEYMSLTAVAG